MNADKRGLSLLMRDRALIPAQFGCFVVQATAKVLLVGAPEFMSVYPDGGCSLPRGVDIKGSSMELVQGQTIKGELLNIDEKQFDDCLLINCVLEYRGGPVCFTRTRLRGCRYVFFDSARSTVHFLQGVGLMTHVLGEWGEFSDTVN